MLRDVLFVVHKSGEKFPIQRAVRIEEEASNRMPAMMGPVDVLACYDSDNKKVAQFHLADISGYYFEDVYPSA